MDRSARHPFLGAGSGRKITCQWARLFKPGKWSCQILWYSHKGDNPIIGLVLGISEFI